MSFTGNLKTVAFPDILQLLSTGKKTGILVITKSNIQKEICFKDGNIIYAQSRNADEDYLGTLLLKQGRITKVDLDRALYLHKSTGKKLGMVLVDMDLFSRNEIATCLKLQIEEIVYNMFSWHDGEFVFQEGKLPDDKDFFTELNTMNILMEGTRRIDEWVEIQKGLPKENETLRIILEPKSKSGEINLSLDQFQILSLIDGVRTVPEIITNSPVGEFVTFRGIYQLINSGLVEIAGVKSLEKKDNGTEEENLWWLLLKLYTICFAAIRRHLEKKLGADNRKINDHLGNYNTGVWSYFFTAGSTDFQANLIKFKKIIKKMPREVQVYKLLTGLNQILIEQISMVRTLLGKNVQRQVISDIKKEIAMPLAEKRDVNNKYSLENELYRALKEYRQG
jgi:Domain of unknown function (DUF4388)